MCICGDEMLSFAKVTDTKTLLANANTLRDFTPFAKTNNTLSVNAFGEIVLSTRPLLPSHAFNPLVKLNIVSKEQQNSFAQEKMIILWHYSHMLTYLERRLAEISAIPKDSIQEYNEFSAAFQGFAQLCDSLLEQQTRLNRLFQTIEKTSLKQEGILFKALQKALSRDMKVLYAKTTDFIFQVTQRRKELLTTEQVTVMNFMALPNVDDLDFDDAAGGTIVTRVNSFMTPCSYEVGRVSVNGAAYKVEASFIASDYSWETVKLNPFSGKLKVSLVDTDEESHGAFEIYPSWTSYGTAPTPMAINEFVSPDDCAANLLHTRLKNQHPACIPLECVVLKARFYSLCDHVKTHQLLPYFMTLVDIARTQRFAEIRFYAPYDESAILFSYGFRISDDDKAEPTVEQQKTLVQTCFNLAQKVPTFANRYNRQTEGGMPILRAFTLDLHDIGSREVYLTKTQEKKTYAELLGPKGIINKQSYPRGIVPETYKIPLHFDRPLFKVISDRELTGNTNKPILHLALSKIDYTKLESNKELETYSFSDPSLANESNYKKLPALTRRKYD